MVPKRKSICECNRHSFCRTLNISKYKLPVKYTVSLFGITAFLYNNEKRHSLSSSWRNHEKKHHTFFLMKKQYQETDKSGCISISRKIKEFQQDIWSWITWEKTGLRAGDISPSYPYVAQAGCRCPGAGRGVLQGRCMRRCRACLMLAPAGPNGPTARAWTGPAAKMAAPWGKWFKKGQNAAQRGVPHREHQGQRRRCPKAEQGKAWEGQVVERNRSVLTTTIPWFPLHCSGQVKHPEVQTLSLQKRAGKVFRCLSLFLTTQIYFKWQ